MRPILRFFYIYKLYDFLNIKLSMLMFYNFNSFTYNLFNKFYKLLICNQDQISELNQFIHKGYQKLKTIDLNKINSLNNELLKFKSKKNQMIEGQVRFEITPEITRIVKKIFFEDLRGITAKMETYYNAKIILSGIMITRNQSVPTSKETFSNYLHNDAYLFTCNQIFINLMDVNHENGPLHYLEFDQQKKFVKKINFFSILKRYFYKNYFHQNDINHNVGKIGNALLVNTSELIHAAGTPLDGYHRDILFLEIAAIPNCKKKQNKMNINIDENFSYNESLALTKVIAKPKNIKTLLKYFFYYYLEKKNLKKINI